MSDIFISYANEDRPRAQMIVRALEARGWSIFWDRRIPYGKTWRETIGNELTWAHCVIVLWSKTSIESSWVQEEADDARARRILVPIRIDDVQPPIGFRGFQTADLVNWSPSKSNPEFERLIADIAALIGSSTRNEAPPTYSTSESPRTRQASAAPPSTPSHPPSPTKTKPQGSSFSLAGAAPFMFTKGVSGGGSIAVSKIVLWTLYLIVIALAIFISIGLIAMTQKAFEQKDWNVFSILLFLITISVGAIYFLRRRIRAAPR
jgi:hypothetical protein